ncbi:hypothetical protein LSEI_0359 [Lacticaseibacillus paracasei ATCC 334]|uniref:Uncharacterized protein n=1 Tax=Lacticaseibacillus paracasei (strain ATCC 334 / BCRC 17002 / CCUG 31169 / CIP 107868 / KCTC 3260 / NRRL B-441) TaxID=321967 RepID=Q03C54_LACP3|nr:hypothetical protein LSEI_0359 [Lacticaseibacillus paracasei ATCC 334]
MLITAYLWDYGFDFVVTNGDF